MLEFDNRTFDVSLRAKVTWTTPLSPLQRAFEAAKKLGSFANESGLINLASAGIASSASSSSSSSSSFGVTGSHQTLTMSPQCRFVSIDIQKVVDANIVNYPSTFVFDAQFSDQNFTFAPEPGSTNQQGSANVTITAHLQSMSTGTFLVANCLGINLPLSLFLRPEAGFPSLSNVIVPAIPHKTLGDDGRVESVVATLTSGQRITYRGASRFSNASGMFDYYQFVETDPLTATVTLTSFLDLICPYSLKSWTRLRELVERVPEALLEGDPAPDEGRGAPPGSAAPRSFT